MRRLAIIDNATHTLYIEDVNEQELEEKYNGEEQAYIDDNYTFEGDYYSWDWIVDAEYIPEGGSDPIDLGSVIDDLDY